MSAMWEVQKSIYDVMMADVILTTLVSSKIYDEPPTDENYPYIVFNEPTEIPDNRHKRLGYSVTQTLNIFTKPYGLGNYTANKILIRLNALLNMKKFDLDSFNMLICYYENGTALREKNKRIIQARYRIICHSSTDITY